MLFSFGKPLPNASSWLNVGNGTEGLGEGPWDGNEDRNGGSFHPCFDPGCSTLGWTVDMGTLTSSKGLVWEWGGVSSGTELSPSVSPPPSIKKGLELLDEGSDENRLLAGTTGLSVVLRGDGFEDDTSGVDRDCTGFAGASENGLLPIQ